MSQLVPLPITPPPGAVATESNRVVEGRWILPHQWMRFVKGRPQKIGGWNLAFATPTSGTPRTLWAWRDVVSNQYLAAGTYRKLYVYDPAYAQNDITPFRLTGTLGNNPFTTVNGSSTITAAHTGHGLSVGDTAIYAGAATFNNVTMNGAYTVQTIIDANTYTVTAGTTANASSAGGGAAVTFQYEIPVGVELAVYGFGWGVGGWGLGTWGTARTQSTVAIEPRVWALDNFGKILLAANAPEGSLYSFDPTVVQPFPRAAIVAAAPTNIRAMFVTPEQFVFALCDNMVVNVCSQGDYTTFTPSTANTAFSRTLAIGTKLVTGRVLGPFVSLVWTDAALYVFQYTGSQFLYESNMVARDCGLIGPSAACAAGGVAYWMGSDNFWMYSGGQVVPMPNVEDIRKYVFDQVNLVNGYQCSATYNPKFDEVWFEITVNGQTNPSLLVIYHISDQCWTPHSHGRCSGTHFTQGDTRPYFGDPSGYIYQHEVGVDGNGSPVTTTLTLSPYAMAEGMRAMDVEGIVLDTFQQSGNIYMTVNTYDRANDTVVQDTESDTVHAPGAALTDLRVSGRHIGLSLSQTDLGAYYRLGKPVAYIRPAGMRR